MAPARPELLAPLRPPAHAWRIDPPPFLAPSLRQAPISDDRRSEDGSIKMRRRRLGQQVEAVLGNASTALVVGGGLTGVELAAELAEQLGPGAVTLAVGPTLPSRGTYPGDPGAGLLPGFRDAEPLVEGQEVPVEGAVCPVGRQRPVCFPGPAESLGLAYAPQSAGRAARKPAVASAARLSVLARRRRLTSHHHQA